MITGAVTRNREAIVRLRLRGPRGVEVEIDAILDTGFTEFLTLPQTSVASLALSQLYTEGLTMADGSIVQADLYECVVVWDGQPRTVPLHCLEGSPLIGMSLFYDHLLTMQVVDGGSVTIAAIP
jgi:predicted aspartyl protease